MLRLIIILLFIFSTTSQNAVASTQTENKISRVIYITLDGIRWQDIFNDHQYFQKLWDKYAKNGIFYGAPGTNTKMEVASIPVSLPSYQSQMAGHVMSCSNNECGRIQQETVIEKLVHQLSLNKKDVAVFSSWSEIGLASENTPGTAFTNTGNIPLVDPDTQIADTTMIEFNQKQTAHNPGDGNRFDIYTISQALHYLEKYQPRFLWISLNDSDEAAHANDLERYHQTLKFNDDAIDQLFQTLEKLNLEKQTLVIVTTDHGRGNGIFWTSHGPLLPESKQTWAFVINGELKEQSREGDIKHYSTLSIRPTIEAAFGIN